jgi:hypothetical protein
MSSLVFTTSFSPKSSDPLVPKKGLGCRAECFQSLTVVLRPVSVLLDHLILG